ncbi:MAG: glucokinase [Croceibacterium sp.]
MIGVVADIGGTHARFASVVRDANGFPILETTRILATKDFSSFDSAFESFISQLPCRPRTASIALACPIASDRMKLTNNHWELEVSSLAETLCVDTLHLLNDFEAIARSIALLPNEQFIPLGIPGFSPAIQGAISVVGPGSGLGVSMLVREPSGDRIVACEGGHVGFSPADDIEIHLLRTLMENRGRVSAERFVSGPGLAEIYLALGRRDGKVMSPPQNIDLWSEALDGKNALAVAALERWLGLLGTFAGDIALAHGATAVVLAGGLLSRLAGRVDFSPLLQRFRAKGRLEAYMDRIPIALIAYPEPGLLGAASLLVEKKVELA